MTILTYLRNSTGLSSSEILTFARTSPHRYKIYQIPKRSSKGFRTIAHPSKELKFIQRVLIKHLEELLPIHSSAYAYIKGKNIKSNALVHLNSKYLLKMDFSDFFTSITPQLFFEQLDLSEIVVNGNDIELLKGFLFCKFTRDDVLRLSIGAPSSPLISNFVLYQFDAEVSAYCTKHKISYSRYADDLTFSTNKKGLLFDIPDFVRVLISDKSNNSISVNQNKTVFSSTAHNRHVTGVTLTNDGQLSVGRDRKRLISSMIYRFKNDELSIEEINKLQGLFAYAVHIEPIFYEKMSLKYGEQSIINLTKYLSK